MRLRSLLFTTAVTTVLYVTSAASAARLCNVQHAADQETAAHAKRSIPILDRSLRVNKEFEALMGSRKWKEGVPMVDQMSAEEASRFGELAQAQKAALFAALIESRRERDIRVIARMTRLADQVYRYGFELPKDEKSEEALLLGIVLSAEEAIPEKDRPAPMEDSQFDGKCTLEVALLLAAGDVIHEVTSMPGYEEWLSKVKVYGQYVKSDPDASRLSVAEREYLEKTFKPTSRVIMNGFWYANTLLRLALVESTSKVMADALRADQYESPADMSYSGTNWKRWVGEGRISPAQNRASGIVNFINEKIPSDFMKN